MATTVSGTSGGNIIQHSLTMELYVHLHVDASGTRE